MTNPKIAVIGGSGLYEMEGLTDVDEVRLPTPFGEPSDTIVVGSLEGVRIAFLPRHGRGHRLTPAEVPSRANIYALKTLGVERIISVSAVGSLRADIRPLDMVVPGQLIDRTVGRPSTFFGRGLVAHVGFADPFCSELSGLLHQAAAETDRTVHLGSTCVVIEGPAFSTKAESLLYRSWGTDIIGMTALPEAKLAREAEICYATLACVTDYDVWHETEEAVNVAMVVANLLSNVAVAKEVIRSVAPSIPVERSCACRNALADAIITNREAIPEGVRQDLAPLVRKYLG